ncbi:MAG: phosphoribosylglycinamide formyltransferase [Planctomycetota bacterium]|nr:phosphoribosylglycinamide formyltransferase [Planctomycetota bacterium]
MGKTVRKVRLAVLVSGSGTTLQNFIDRIKEGSLNAQIVCVVSSSSKAYALERARKNSIPATTIRRSDFPDTRSFSNAIYEYLEKFNPELIALAGFLKLLAVPERWRGRIMNIHPALLPSFGGEGFYGLRVHQEALAYGVKVSGCTVHFVDEKYDHGPIILQKAVPVYTTDTPETLQKRVFEKECEAYPEAINLFAAGRLKLSGRIVEILPEA